ncbi:MAG: hypothetical protein BLITH_0675 [Brockia lithotrophica]|uniref:Uncharacterized protein n=1 Tax=Brockia lithotrophica TaxID=933949 RepID=A0A2T5G8H9_9BACL|nr:MAG: hypothetical protein BLITH_0675 [Brockia lithotrophica]
MATGESHLPPPFLRIPKRSYLDPWDPPLLYGRTGSEGVKSP